MSATTALVLAGGRGQRMGGRDKGWQPHLGQPLVAHCLQRLQAQSWPLAETLISANRNLAAYAALGHRVCADAPDSKNNPLSSAFEGPMAGVRSGLAHCTTPWLLCVPCDAPHLPLDLLERLHTGLQHHRAQSAVAAVWCPDRMGWQLQPLFCLLHTSLAAPLQQHWQQGGRAMRDWLQAMGSVAVPFAPPAQGPAPFANINTLAADPPCPP